VGAGGGGAAGAGSGGGRLEGETPLSSLRRLARLFRPARREPLAAAPLAADLERAGEYWDAHNLAPADDVVYWLAVPAVRAAVNRRLTGDPETLYITRFLAALHDGPPPRRALSVGCGTGELDRGIALEGGVAQVDGIDVSAASLAAAEALAAEAGLGGRLRYRRVDAASWLADARRRYDLIFFHGSLHHVEDLEGVLSGAAAALAGGSPGLLYVDEYVGPSRDEWGEEHLRAAAELFARVPAEHCRTPAVWPPIGVDDPTEMIRSSEIPAVIEHFFDLLDHRPYYGNVLTPLVAAIRGSALGEPAVAAVIDEAIAQEEALAAAGTAAPLYAIYVGRPKPLTSRGRSGSR
jgi:SAM-dependent methyltransferase